MQSERAFSYEDHDGPGSPSHEQQHLTYQQPDFHQPYHDAPSRDIISPPPVYSSPAPPRNPSAFPTNDHRSPSRHSHSSSQGRVSREIRRRPLSPEYQDEAPPPPPPHRTSPVRLSRPDSRNSQGYRPTSNVTVGMDNFSNQAEGGGLNHVARGVADGNPRESGLEALHAVQADTEQHSHHPPDRDYSGTSSPYSFNQPSRGARLPERASYASNLPLTAGAATPGSATPGTSVDPRSSRYSARSIPLEDYPSHQSHPMAYASYQDSPFHNSSQFNSAVNEASINPNNILDDDDDGFIDPPQRKSMLNGMMSHKQSKRSSYVAPGIGAGAAPAVANGGGFNKQQVSGTYNAVSTNNDGAGSAEAEKSEWLARQTGGRRRMRWIVGAVISLVIIIAIVAGIVGGVLGTHNAGGGGSSNSNTNNAASDSAANGDLGKDSSEIQALLNNKNLHKVFPGMDYTPWGTQYPLCEIYPPSQNNVTRDMAVLSQLTNAVRLYGTDCNQTEMVLHAIDRLGLTDMKIWLGVWIDTNQTTIDRQMKKMYKILEDYDDHSIFKGVIIGNEALYRAGESKAQSQQELIDILTDTRTKFKSKGYDLPIATSDLGDNWNGQLVQVVDVVMSNIHPFFAGVTAEKAAAWTWKVWQEHDVVLTSALPNVHQIISETGWPSDGGKDCGGTTGVCAPGQSGAIASIDNMNRFMDDWVCQALDNGTDYFWFEAFDEPWKVVYNEDDRNWEDKWGLMDQARELKPGLKIPSCGGQTVSS